MRSTLCLTLLAAATLPLLAAMPASAQLLSRPSHPFTVYINIPLETISALTDNSDNSDSSQYYDPGDAEQSVGFSATYDLFRTPLGRRPMLFSAYYDYLSVCNSFSTSYDQHNGVSSEFPGTEHLRAQGVGLQARFYVAGKNPARGLESSTGIYFSAAEGFYHVTGSRDAVGLSASPMYQWASETRLSPKFSLGYEGLGFVNLQVTYCLFNNLGISSFNSNQPLVIQAGLRF